MDVLNRGKEQFVAALLASLQPSKDVPRRREPLRVTRRPHARICLFPPSRLIDTQQHC